MPRTFRLAAIDIDGTLIHENSRTISDANLRAIARMQAGGIEIVLASGRHHHSMLKYAAQIPGVRWLVSSQGAEASDTSRRDIVFKTFLAPDTARRAIALGRVLGHAIVVYADDGVYRLDAPEKIAAYAGLDGGKITPLNDAEALAKPLFKVIWLGAETGMDALGTNPELDALDVTGVRTHAYLYELLPRDVTKATGAARLAARLGIAAPETLAFGDAENDIPLFRWAGLSVAMPSRWTAARAAATLVAPEGPPETAFARGVELALAHASLPQ